MKILFACKEFPHSKIIGGPIIIYNRLKYFSRNHTVSLAAFFKEEEKKFIPSVEPFCHNLRLVPLPPKRSSLKVSWDFFTSSVIEEPCGQGIVFSSEPLAHVEESLLAHDSLTNGGEVSY